MIDQFWMGMLFDGVEKSSDRLEGNLRRIGGGIAVCGYLRAESRRKLRAVSQKCN